MLDAYMRWGLQHPNAYHLVYVATRPVSESLDEGVADLSAECYEIFSGVVREIAAAGRLRNGNADSASQSLWMACHGVVALLIGRPNFDWQDHDELLAITLDGLLHGLIID